MTTPSILLDIEGLTTSFHTEGQAVKAIDGLSLRIQEGHTLGLVGESGSGKSVTSLSIMRLLPKVTAQAGKISFLGHDVVRMTSEELNKIRGRDMSMIFQEPGTSLNPVHRVGDQVAEVIRVHEKVSKAEARRRTIDLFNEVGIPESNRRVDNYPHEMSGGQKQRVMIAMALSCNPKLLIADEPTTALDVTIQAQILDLIRRLRDERGMAILFITHDLGVIAEIADEVAVMFLGQIVEYAATAKIFESPQHPYTKGLLACRPRLDTKFKRLPVVADFMETKKDKHGGSVVVEKTVDDVRLNQLISTGRGRLLSPTSEWQGKISPFEEEGHASDVRTVPEDRVPLLAVRDLKVHFPIRKRVLGGAASYVQAVDGISLNVYKGQTLGLVGESGCGKTTTGRAILRLLPITAGTVHFDGHVFSQLKGSPLRALRRRMQVIFQDPYSSLNPRLTVESLLTEPMLLNRLGGSKNERQERAVQLLREVGLEPDHLGRYPRHFSGGQRQRICIARALAAEPDFIICDESVSALDVSVQAQVLNLLKDLQETRELTYIFISHDLSVVKFMSDMMAVMKAGKIVEFGPSESIYAQPQDPYTKKLIAAVPDDNLENVLLRQQNREAAWHGRNAATKLQEP